MAYVLIDAGFGEEFQELELSQSSKAEEGVIERENLLYRDLAIGGFMESGGDGSIGAFANGMQDLVVITYDREKISARLAEEGQHTDFELGKWLGVLAGGHVLLLPQNQPAVFAEISVRAKRSW